MDVVVGGWWRAVASVKLWPFSKRLLPQRAGCSLERRACTDGGESCKHQNGAHEWGALVPQILRQSPILGMARLPPPHTCTAGSVRISISMKSSLLVTPTVITRNDLCQIKLPCALVVRKISLHSTLLCHGRADPYKGATCHLGLSSAQLVIAMHVSGACARA